MESTRHKTFTPRWTLLSVAAVLAFILLIYPALSAAGQYKLDRVTDGDTIKVVNDVKTSIIRLESIDAPETSLKKIEAGLPFYHHCTKNIADLVLNKFVKKTVTAMIDVVELRGLFFVDGMQHIDNDSDLNLEEPST